MVKARATPRLWALVGAPLLALTVAVAGFLLQCMQALAEDDMLPP